MLLLVMLSAAVLAGEADVADAAARALGGATEGSKPWWMPPPNPARAVKAVALRCMGAFEDASAMLDAARRASGDADDEVAYHTGVLLEVTEQWGAAVAAYRRVTRTWPDSPSANDAGFRMAYCLEEMGQHKDSVRAVRQLQRNGRWSAADERRNCSAASPRPERARPWGIRRIAKALESGDTCTDSRQSAARPCASPDRRGRRDASRATLAARQLQKRSQLIASAEKQAIAMFTLGEPEFALEGLLLLRRGVALYDAMLAYPPPRSVPADQHEAYRETAASRPSCAPGHARYDEGAGRGTNAVGGVGYGASAGGAGEVRPLERTERAVGRLRALRLDLTQESLGAFVGPEVASEGGVIALHRDAHSVVRSAFDCGAHDARPGELGGHAVLGQPTLGADHAGGGAVEADSSCHAAGTSVSSSSPALRIGCRRQVCTSIVDQAAGFIGFAFTGRWFHRSCPRFPGRR